MKVFSPKNAQNDLHASVFDAVTIFNTRGGLIDVHADGNCGYHACKNILVQWGLIQHSLSIGDLRNQILHYALANEKKMVGLEEMG